jgi:G3E family GTPase
MTAADDKSIGERLAASGSALAMLSGIFEVARLLPERLRAADNSLPLTVISGFLGAGKTTLVNRLLRDPGGRRIIVLVNDFGSINIDAELIESRAEDMIGLTNGCACCTVAGDLTGALLRIAQREDPPDAIVLESSGLADPHGIAQVALANPAIRLDGVVTLVDCETFLENAAGERTAALVASQIGAADLIVVNKIDLGSARRDEVMAAMAAAGTSRPTIIEATHADVPADVILGIGNPRSFRFMCESDTHEQAFSSWARVWDIPLDRSRLEQALEALPAGVLRVKGVFRFPQEPAERHVFQQVGVRRSWLREPAAEDGVASQLVVIGQAPCLDEATMERIFEGVAASAA